MNSVLLLLLLILIDTKLQQFGKKVPDFFTAIWILDTQLLIADRSAPTGKLWLTLKFQSLQKLTFSVSRQNLGVDTTGLELRGQLESCNYDRTCSTWFRPHKSPDTSQAQKSFQKAGLPTFSPSHSPFLNLGLFSSSQPSP